MTEKTMTKEEKPGVPKGANGFARTKDGCKPIIGGKVQDDTERVPYEEYWGRELAVKLRGNPYRLLKAFQAAIVHSKATWPPPPDKSKKENPTG